MTDFLDGLLPSNVNYAIVNYASITASTFDVFVRLAVSTNQEFQTWKAEFQRITDCHWSTSSKQEGPSRNNVPFNATNYVCTSNKDCPAKIFLRRKTHKGVVLVDAFDKAGLPTAVRIVWDHNHKFSSALTVLYGRCDSSVHETFSKLLAQGFGHEAAQLTCRNKLRFPVAGMIAKSPTKKLSDEGSQVTVITLEDDNNFAEKTTDELTVIATNEKQKQPQTDQSNQSISSRDNDISRLETDQSNSFPSMQQPEADQSDQFVSSRDTSFVSVSPTPSSSSVEILENESTFASLPAASMIAECNQPTREQYSGLPLHMESITLDTRNPLEVAAAQPPNINLEQPVTEELSLTDSVATASAQHSTTIKCAAAYLVKHNFCAVCTKLVKSTHLRDHIRSHFKEYFPFRCPLCEERKKTSNGRWAHFRMTHNVNNMLSIEAGLVRFDEKIPEVEKQIKSLINHCRDCGSHEDAVKTRRRVLIEFGDQLISTEIYVTMNRPRHNWKQITRIYNDANWSNKVLTKFHDNNNDKNKTSNRAEVAVAQRPVATSIDNFEQPIREDQTLIDSAAAISSHEQSATMSSVEEKQSFCVVCTKQLKLTHMRDHIRTHFKDYYPFYCPTCHVGRKTSVDRWSHYRKRHQHGDSASWYSELTMRRFDQKLPHMEKLIKTLFKCCENCSSHENALNTRKHVLIEFGDHLTSIEIDNTTKPTRTHKRRRLKETPEAGETAPEILNYNDGNTDPFRVFNSDVNGANMEQHAPVESRAVYNGTAAEVALAQKTSVDYFKQPITEEQSLIDSTSTTSSKRSRPMPSCFKWYKYQFCVVCTKLVKQTHLLDHIRLHCRDYYPFCCPKCHVHKKTSAGRCNHFRSKHHAPAGSGVYIKGSLDAFDKKLPFMENLIHTVFKYCGECSSSADILKARQLVLAEFGNHLISTELVKNDSPQLNATQEQRIFNHTNIANFNNQIPFESQDTVHDMNLQISSNDIKGNFNPDPPITFLMHEPGHSGILKTTIVNVSGSSSMAAENCVPQNECRIFAATSSDWLQSTSRDRTSSKRTNEICGSATAIVTDGLAVPLKESKPEMIDPDEEVFVIFPKLECPDSESAMSFAK